MNKRYQVSGAEGKFESGSNGLVLRNLVGITSPEDMDALELQLLGDLYEEVLLNDFPDRALTVADLKRWHQLWLGNVYPWAGKERSVNLGKDGFQFATAALLPGLLDEFEREYLARRTPCRHLTRDELVNAIAVTHVELIVIHPFLDYTGWEQHKAAYIGAIHAGLSGDYSRMREFVASAINAGNASVNAPV